MKKLAIALGATVATSAALFAPAPASATCTEVIDDGGCIENTVCGAVDRATAKTPGRDLNCIN